MSNNNSNSHKKSWWKQAILIFIAIFCVMTCYYIVYPAAVQVDEEGNVIEKSGLQKLSPSNVSEVVKETIGVKSQKQHYEEARKEQKELKASWSDWGWSAFYYIKWYVAPIIVLAVVAWIGYTFWPAEDMMTDQQIRKKRN